MAGTVNFIEEYVVLPFKSKKIKDKYLVTTETSGWVFLDNYQFELLKSIRVQEDGSLFSILKAKGIIVVKDDFKQVTQRLKNRFWHLDNGTSLHVIALTNNCNLKCKYCYAPSQNQVKMSEKQGEKVVNFILASPAKINIIEFSGGEPLLNFEVLKTIVKFAKKVSDEKNKEVEFAMIHNGTNWDEEKMKFFIDEKIGICFSLDGPEDLHNKHRPFLNGEGTYEEVSKWISKFKKSGVNGLNAIPVITKYSLSRGKEIVDEYLSHGFRVVRFKYLAYFGRAADIWDEIGYTPEEFLKAWKEVIEYMFELNKKGILIIEGVAQVLAQKIFRNRDPGFCELHMPCGAGIGQLAYAPTGDIYTCDEGRMFEEFRIGTVNQKYSEVMKNSLLREMSIASSGFLNSCDHCVFKPFCGICPLESYKIQGSIYSKVPLDRRCKIHKGMLEYLFKRMLEDVKFKKMIKMWSETDNLTELKVKREFTNSSMLY